MLNSIIIVRMFGTVAFVTTTIGLVPQMLKVLRSKSTGDISMFMLVNCAICAISWIIYGIYEDTMTVVWSNVVGLVVSFILIGQKLYYDK